MQELANYFLGLFSNLFNALKQWIQDIIIYILEFILEGIQQILHWLFQIVLWVLDKVALMCTGYGIDTSSAWVGVPVKTLAFLHAVNILSVIQIIICAIFVRMVLNLIPAWAIRI